MRRLLTMRRLVFGLGGLQTLLTTVVISFGALCSASRRRRR